MKQELSDKIRQNFTAMAIFKDPDSTNSLFSGRNLPSFVKDFLLKRYIDFDGNLNRAGLTSFLDMVIPQKKALCRPGLNTALSIHHLHRFGEECEAFFHPGYGY